MKPHVLIAPAQFLVPADYAKLCSTLVSDHSFPSARCVPLSRPDWLKVVPSSPPGKFINGDLDPSESLEWYYTAIERGMSDILAESENEQASVAIVGHSIGGWVSASYLSLNPLRTSISHLVQKSVEGDPSSTLAVTR